MNKLEEEISNWADWKKDISKDIYGIDFNKKNTVICSWCGEIYNKADFCCPRCQQQEI